jgi:hypothetical protein
MKNTENIHLIYCKDDKVRCLNSYEANLVNDLLKREGWVHASSICLAQWVESLCMGHGDATVMIEDLINGNVKNSQLIEIQK